VKFALVLFVLRRVAKSIREFLWTHVLTAGIMALTLAIFGGFLLLQQNLQGVLRGWGSQLEVFAYLKDGLSPEEVDSVLSRVRSLPEVEELRYVSKKDAWDDFEKGLGAQSGVLEGLTADILPSSVDVRLKSAYQEEAAVEAVAAKLRVIPGIGEVEYPGEWVSKLHGVTLGVQWAKWIFGGFLFLATLFIVGSTVKLAILSRRDEIEIMQLVGAPAGLIKAPFVVEGMIQGIFGALLSLLLLWLCFVLLTLRLPALIAPFSSQGQLRFLDLYGVSLLFLLGWFVGAGGSLLSLRRFLKT
jgi:cell division transport system permease protein